LNTFTRLAATVGTASALLVSAAPAALAAPGWTPQGTPPGLAKQDTLRWVAPGDLVIGTAVAGGGHHLDQDYVGLEPGQSPFLFDAEYRRHLAAEFSSLSPENQMKWEFIHPEQGRYDFAEADAVVAFAKENKQVVRGHTLLWHSQNPAWLEQGDFADEELRAILKDHSRLWWAATRAGSSSGTSPTRSSTGRASCAPRRTSGSGSSAQASSRTPSGGPREADPKALLFFNDYGVESVNAKSDAYYRLIQDLLAQGVPVHGFSVQGHLSTRYGFPGDLQKNLERFDDLGLETAITELDVRMDVPAGQQPTAAMLERQATDYRRALEACLAVEDCNSFTIWGFTDKYSWVPVFFAGQGFANVLTETYERKPAYDALQTTLAAARPNGVQRFDKHPATRG
jgi:endo-1,4-beta-xylanase